MDKRDYIVEQRIAVTKDIASFVLKPVNGGICSFVPGQYLVLDLAELGIRREYSISYGDGLSYRITVKREAAPPAQAGQPDVPTGQGSNWVHDNLHDGDVISAWGPAGGFNLQRDSNRPVVLLSGGVGITPVLSMLHTLAKQGTRPTWFVHACENGEQHAYKDEVKTVSAKHDNVQHRFAYRQPLAADQLGDDYHVAGLVSKALLQSLLPIDNYEFYLCGPGGFMQACYDILVELGVADDSIHYEFFGPATLVRAKPVGSNSSERSTKQQPSITYSKTGATFTWDPELDNLLDFAEEQGVFPNHSCRFGTCGTCSTKIISGEVEYFQDILDDVNEGEVLLCSCRPITDIEIEL
jgi:ferredoxin-NADP reductase